MKRFLNLKFSVFSHINFRAFVLIIVALWVVIPLKGVAQATMSELTKKVDFSSEVKMVSQKYDYWCYYACLESIRMTYNVFIVLTLYIVISWMDNLTHIQKRM